MVLSAGLEKVFSYEKDSSLRIGTNVGHIVCKLRSSLIVLLLFFYKQQFLFGLRFLSQAIGHLPPMHINVHIIPCEGQSSLTI